MNSIFKNYQKYENSLVDPNPEYQYQYLVVIITGLTKFSNPKKLSSRV